MRAGGERGPVALQPGHADAHVLWTGDRGDVPAADLMTPLIASRIIRETGITMLDVVSD